jgi:predicted restriction endonuclease
MSKIHYATFDVGLIGIDPDYTIHVSDHLAETTGSKFHLRLSAA